MCDISDRDLPGFNKAQFKMGVLKFVTCFIWLVMLLIQMNFAASVRASNKTTGTESDGQNCTENLIANDIGLSNCTTNGSASLTTNQLSVNSTDGSLAITASDKQNGEMATSGDNRRCTIQKLINQRVVSETELDNLSPEEAGALEGGRIWNRPSRLSRGMINPDPRGFGTAFTLNIICELCRKRQVRRCLRRFCAIRRRTGIVEVIKVECF